MVESNLPYSRSDFGDFGFTIVTGADGERQLKVMDLDRHREFVDRIFGRFGDLNCLRHHAQSCLEEGRRYCDEIGNARLARDRFVPEDVQ